MIKMPSFYRSSDLQVKKTGREQPPRPGVRASVRSTLPIIGRAQKNIFSPSSPQELWRQILIKRREKISANSALTYELVETRENQGLRAHVQYLYTVESGFDCSFSPIETSPKGRNMATIPVKTRLHCVHAEQVQWMSFTALYRNYIVAQYANVRNSMDATAAMKATFA